MAAVQTHKTLVTFPPLFTTIESVELQLIRPQTAFRDLVQGQALHWPNESRDRHKKENPPWPKPQGE
jgi:hypothetical protein